MPADTPFAFIPRIISKHAKPWQGISTHSPSPSSDPTTDEEDDDEPSTEPSKVKGKEKAIEPAHSKQSTLAQDIATLISLALSDYNIWLDADFRHKLDACLNDESAPDGAGFVPINYLLRRAPFRGALSHVDNDSEPSEIEVVKALRTHASHVLEVRMRLPSSSSVWYGTGKTSRKKDVGGYEVRRKDWVSLQNWPSRGWTRARWDDLTMYMEGIPPPYRTIGSIARFAEMLLSLEMEAPLFCIQNVTLPPHYLDKPGDTPKCKGYALVTFSTSSHVKTLLRAWPWKRVDVVKEDTRQLVQEAQKYGTRTVSKARWDAFNEEYLSYKQTLVDAIAQADVSGDAIETQHTQEDDCEAPPAPRRTTLGSAYPFDCLVFVRHVHPETNKTTLRALFGRTFQDDRGHAAQVQIDYVDFTKGMDTCYLRLASPHHTARLMAYFARGIVQGDGLDAVGHERVEDEESIVLEMIQGKKEALYWEKVPEKVRRQAVDKAVKADTNVEPSSPTTHKRKKRTREP